MGGGDVWVEKEEGDWRWCVYLPGCTCHLVSRARLWSPLEDGACHEYTCVHMSFTFLAAAI